YQPRRRRSREPIDSGGQNSTPSVGIGDGLAGVPVNGSVPLTGTRDALAGVWVVATGVGIIGLNGSELNGRGVGVPIMFVVVPLDMLEEVEVVVPPEDIMPV